MVWQLRDARILALLLLVATAANAGWFHQLPQRPPFMSATRLLLSVDDGKIPPGRVEDRDAWVIHCSDSLLRCTGTSLWDRMGIVESRDPALIHDHSRYALLSHGTQEDPIYCYFNRAALLTFEWPESEVYRLPSRYSAPEGPARQRRSQLLQTVDGSSTEPVRIIPTALRQNKFGTCFQLREVLYWNVWNEKGELLGQSALFDRQLIREGGEEEEDAPLVQ